MLVHKIGFSPKVVNDTALAEEYEGLDMEADNYMLNSYRAHVHKKRKELKEYRYPVDKSRYGHCIAAGATMVIIPRFAHGPTASHAAHMNS